MVVMAWIGVAGAVGRVRVLDRTKQIESSGSLCRCYSERSHLDITVTRCEVSLSSGTKSKV